MKTVPLLVSITLLFPMPLRAESGEIAGRVLDQRGRPLAMARVMIRGPEGTILQSRTNETGEFHLEPVAFPAHIQVYAAGFGVHEDVIEGPLQSGLLIRLVPSRLGDSVTVTASRASVPTTRSTQNVISRSWIDRDSGAAQTLDDYLRGIPGFTLFRRTSSLVAHPTAQGVSLRGVGPSGASRSLVLADGIPLNDPFGGWVYWGRIPRLSIERMEVLRGGASELYGTDAVGGVIQLFRRRPARREAGLEAYVGSFDNRSLSFFLSDRLGGHGFALAGDFFRTGGYIQVEKSQRGAVDLAARSKRRALEAQWEFRPDPSARLYAVAGEFSERRGNGTPLQANDTQVRSVAGGASFVTQGKNEWELRSFFVSETLDSLFSAVAEDRNTESLTRAQRVPSRSGGAQGLWRRRLGVRHLLVAGADFSFVQGESDETGFFAGAPTGRTVFEGRQDRAGLYLQDLVRATSRLEIVLGARWDFWKNRNAASTFTSFQTGTTSRSPLPSRSDSAWSPKLGARLDLGMDFALRGSISRSFRAPTLNELYRPFRVGNIVTSANPLLAPERAASGEIGIDWGLRSPLAIRGTLYWNEMDGTIANVTLSAGPGLITRQRQNLGTTRSRGIELDALWSPDPRWNLAAGYVYADSTVRYAPRAPDLEGLRIPQVPRHQAVLRLEHRKEGDFYAHALLRLSGRQFDDDRNRLELDSYAVVDLAAGKSIHAMAELFVACENLLNSSYTVARTPVDLLGMPRRIHGGLRIRLE